MPEGQQTDVPDGIDAPALEAWFGAHVPEAVPPLQYERIAGGRSNLTYSVTDAEGRRWALRRPPLGKGLGSAHDMSREYKVVSALAGTAVPVAPIAGIAEDDSVIGAPFYVMDFVDGPILRTREDAAGFSPDEQRRIGERVIETLVAIHAVNPDDVGLGDLGKKEDYVARQLHRWQGQWDKSQIPELERAPLVDDLHDRLKAKIPVQGPATLVHGDYRLDNMILNGAGRISAVVDWELCTLGDPLADVGLLVVYWAEEGDDLIPLFEPATMEAGFPSRAEIRELYAKLSGRDLSELDYFVALGYWKLAIILQGILARVAAGAYGKDAAQEQGLETFKRTVERCAEAADEALRAL